MPYTSIYPTQMTVYATGTSAAGTYYDRVPVTGVRISYNNDPADCNLTSSSYQITQPWVNTYEVQVSGSTTWQAWNTIMYEVADTAGAAARSLQRTGEAIGAAGRQISEQARRAAQAHIDLRQRSDRGERSRRIQRKHAARRRARTLLLSVLDAAQRKQWLEERKFVVCTRSGRKYEIRNGLQGNVYALDKHGRRTHSYCCHVYGDVPVEDNVVTQLLTLKTDEKTFLARANATPVAA